LRWRVHTLVLLVEALVIAGAIIVGAATWIVFAAILAFVIAVLQLTHSGGRQ
jgi:hypothetical protein